MKRYKKLIEEEMIDNTDENRKLQIHNIAEDYADWMAEAHCAYVGHRSSHEFTKKLFITRTVKPRPLGSGYKVLKNYDFKTYFSINNDNHL